MIHRIRKLLKLHGGKDIIVIKGKKLTLSVKIILLLVSSGVMSILCYGLCRYYVTDFYTFARNITHESFDSDTFFEDFSENSKDVSVYSEEESDKKKLKRLLNKHDKYTSVYLYDYFSGEYITGDFGSILDERMPIIVPLTILQSDFEQYSYNMFEERIVEFQDGYVYVYVSDMHDLKYSNYYFYMTLILCLLVFFLPTFIFIRHKVKYINCLKNEILNISQGDLQHPITIQSYDELAVLAGEMDSLRVTLDQNIQAEKQMKQANNELITSLSHDLRTPLTSLRGYLDILRLHRYQNDEQMEKYIYNCIEKVNQINDLSNKTFEYALVFEHDVHVEYDKISSLEIINYLDENLDYLQLEGFQIQKTFDYYDVLMIVNFAMIKRMINNLCSNIHKYALSSKPILINLSIKQNQMKMTFSNDKRTDLNHIESNKIGLKSVERIIELHQGELFIQDLENSFTIVITIPFK